jgi:putative MATE family efflux protein
MSTGRFLTGSTMGHVVRMTSTGAFGITFVFLVDAANLVWLSQLGDPQLVAAVGFAFAIQFFSVSSGIGLMIAATALVSRRIGAGDRNGARDRAGASIVTAVVLQALMAATVVAFRHDLVALAGAEGRTAELAARYLLFTVPSLVLMAVGMNCSAVLRAEGFGAKAMYITLWSGAVLMVVDPIFILWFGWGLDGAALGLVLFRVALMALGVYFAVWQQDLVRFPDVATIWSMLPAYLAVAVPAIGAQIATPAGNYLLTMVMAPFGDDAVAAWAVIGRLTVVAFGGIFALSGAIGGIFGQNFAAGQYMRLRSTYRDAVLFCLIYTLFVWGALVLATPWIAVLFGLEGQGLAVLRAFTSIGVGGFVFVGALFVANAAFNNLGKPARSAWLNWAKEAALGWPAAALIAGLIGAPGVIYGQALASAVIGTLACLWGWRFVEGLRETPPDALDLAPPRPYPNPDRYRRR